MQLHYIYITQTITRSLDISNYQITHFQAFCVRIYSDAKNVYPNGCTRCTLRRAEMFCITAARGDSPYRFSDGARVLFWFRSISGGNAKPRVCITRAFRIIVSLYLSGATMRNSLGRRIKGGCCAECERGGISRADYVLLRKAKLVQQFRKLSRGQRYTFINQACRVTVSGPQESSSVSALSLSPSLPHSPFIYGCLSSSLSRSFSSVCPFFTFEPTFLYVFHSYS